MEWLKFGVYMHKKNGNLAIMEKPTQEKDVHWDFIWDKNQVQRHPILRVSWNVVQRGQGEYFFNKAIKNYEYLSEL